MSGRSRVASLVFLLLVVPGLLLAHGALKRSDPAANATLDAVPTTIRLTFTEPAELAVGRIELTGPDGRSVALSTVRHGDSATVMIADILAALQAGRYTVAWQVAGRDGHPVRGTFAFTISEGAAGLAVPLASASPPTPADSAVPASIAGHDGHPADAMPDVDAFDAESPLFVAVRWLGFAGLIALVGVVAFSRLLVPDALRRQAPAEWGSRALHGARRVGRAALAVLAVALVLRLAAQTVAVHGGIPAIDTALITGTLWGKAWAIQLAGLLLAAGALVPAREAGAGRALLLLATIVVAVSFSLSGHATAVPENMAFAVPIDTIHILGAGGWMGTLLLVVAVGLPAAMHSESGERGRTVAVLINSFSPLALIFAGTAALTGFVSARTQLGSLEALWTTRYGQVLLIKLALVLLVIGAGAYNSWRVRPALGDERGGARIRRSATTELVFAALVLAVTAVLVATPTGVSSQ